MRDWHNEPMTPEEEAAWDEHEAYLVAQGQHDRAAYLEQRERALYFHDKEEAHKMNVAICEALVNLKPWEE